MSPKFTLGLAPHLKSHNFSAAVTRAAPKAATSSTGLPLCWAAWAKPCWAALCSKMVNSVTAAVETAAARAVATWHARVTCLRPCRVNSYAYCVCVYSCADVCVCMCVCVHLACTGDLPQALQGELICLLRVCIFICWCVCVCVCVCVWPPGMHG